MEIIYIVNKRIPTDKAHGYQIAKMCEAFAEVGARVSLWLPERKNNIEQDLFSFYKIKESFKVRYIKGKDFIAIPRLGRYAFWFQTLQFILRLLFIKLPKDAIIYTRNPEIILLAKLRGRTVIYEDHGWPKNVKVYVQLVKWADRIVAITHGIKQEYTAHGFDEKNILVAADSVDLEEFSLNEEKMVARKIVGLPFDKKIVTYTGSFYLYAWKGIDVLLSAEQYIDPNAIIVLVGGNKQEIEDIKRRFPTTRVLLFEKRPRHEVALFLRASNILVLPNKKGDPTSEKYTSPLKLFEYMASGVPIVASRLPSITEILNDTNATLVEPSVATALAEGINATLSDKANADMKAKQARVDVKSFTWFKRAERIIQHIRELS